MNGLRDKIIQEMRLLDIPLNACGCVGPQNGQPRCPCAMRGVIVRDGRYIQKEVDLGPAPPARGLPESKE